MEQTRLRSMIPDAWALPWRGRHLERLGPKLWILNIPKPNPEIV